MQRIKPSDIDNALLQIWYECDLYLQHLELAYAKCHDSAINNKILLIKNLMRGSCDPAEQQSIGSSKHSYRVSNFKHNESVKNIMKFMEGLQVIKGQLESRRDVIGENFLNKIANIFGSILNALFGTVHGKDFAKKVTSIYDDIKKLKPKYFTQNAASITKFASVPIFDNYMKILVWGDVKVGKSAILDRFCKNTFTESHYSTVGLEFSIKTLDINNYTVKFAVYEYKGYLHPHRPSSGEYRGAHACMVVYDVTNQESFAHVKNWIDEIKQTFSPEMPIILVGNKCDLLSEREVSVEDAKEFAEQMNLNFLEISAKDAINIEEAFSKLGIKELERRQEIEEEEIKRYSRSHNH